MASVMAIGSEVIGECVEQIRVKVMEGSIEDSFGVRCFWLGAQSLVGSIVRQC